MTSEADKVRADAARIDMRGVLPAGTTLRGYELKAILGQGGFGITYRARDTTLGRDVAVKEYLPAMLAVREGRTTVVPRSADHAEQFAWGRERFLDEARTLARFDGTPAIVRVLDYLEANGTAYMVMALIEGETLTKRLMREQRLAPEAIERLLFPLLDGLEEMHGAGFLHRDIKPANIMVDPRGRPTLIDFGASRAAMAEHSATMTAIFTPGYAAAEQFSSAKLGPWTDIYGLAATFHHAIAGHIPPSAIDRILNDTCEKLAELRPDGFAPELLAGIDAGLAVRAADRPQNIAEWRYRLRSEESLAASRDATRVARKPGPLARVAGRTRRARLTLGGPALWGAAAAAVVLLLAGGGYVAFQATAPASVATAALGLSAEQLEQALAERRKADALAIEKRRLEDEARQRAEAETEAKRQADAELAQAREARLKVEEELAKLKADIEARRQAVSGQREQAEGSAQRAAEEEARRKAEAEVAALRQAEEEARKKAAADAEAKRQADEALARAEAERQRAEQEARQKAEAENAALSHASEETQRKAAAEAKIQAEREKAEGDKAAAAAAKQREEAEGAEKELRLEAADRVRLQVALKSLGFDTRGSDGVFGPRSREMIAAWQKARNQPATGFLNVAQQQALLREAAQAVAKYDEQKKAEEEAKARSATVSAAVATPGSTVAAPAAASPNARPPIGLVPSGMYTGTLVLALPDQLFRMSVQITDGSGKGTVTVAGCGSAPMSVRVDPAGAVTGELGFFNPSCSLSVLPIEGRVDAGRLNLFIVTGRGGGGMRRREFILAPGGGSGASSTAPLSPDGLWRGTYACGPGVGIIASSFPEFSFPLDLRLTEGAGTWKSGNASVANGGTIEVDVSVGAGEVKIRRHGAANISGVANMSLSGQYDGNVIRAVGRESVGLRECTVDLTRV